MLDPLNHSVVIDPCAAFNGSKSHSIDVEFQAVTFDFVAVASVAVRLYKLAATLLADVALLAILVTILGAIARFASRAFHYYSMQRRLFFVQGALLGV